MRYLVTIMLLLSGCAARLNLTIETDDAVYGTDTKTRSSEKPPTVPTLLNRITP